MSVSRLCEFLEIFVPKTRKSKLKISKYKIHFDKAKISKYDKISRFSKIFRNLVRRISAIFQVFTHFPHVFRGDLEKSWKINVSVAKIGADTAANKPSKVCWYQPTISPPPLPGPWIPLWRRPDPPEPLHLHLGEESSAFENDGHYFTSSSFSGCSSC